MSIIAILFLLLFLLNALFSNVAASKLEGFLDQHTSSWNIRTKALFFILVLLTLSIPQVLFFPSEFTPESGVPTTSLALPVMVTILACLIASAIVWEYVHEQHKRWYYIGAITLVAILMLAALVQRRAILAESRVVYFLVDASSSQDRVAMQEVSAVLELEALRVPERAAIAMATYGSGLERINGCGDVVELVGPSPVNDETVQRIRNAVELLGQVQSNNFGGAHEAVQFALQQLKDREGIHQIFLISSNSRTPCQPIDRVKLDEVAKDNGIERFELNAFVIGGLAEDDLQLLRSASQRVFVPEQPDENLLEQLQNAIQEVLDTPPVTFYGYSYRQ